MRRRTHSGAYLVAVSACAAALTVLAACTKPTDPAPPVGVQIQPEDPVLIVRLNQSRTLSAVCLNSAGQPVAGVTVTWFSNNPLVVEVAEDGTISGKAVGQATVSATCGTVSDQVTIQVTLVPPETVTTSHTQLTMTVGQQQQLAATATDSAGNVLDLLGRQVLWTSDNLPVASVSGAGVVQAVSAGVANIRVSVDGVQSAPVVVTVQNVPVASVTINPLNPTVRAGQLAQLTVVLRDANNNILGNRPVIWRSLDTNVATINQSGVVAGVSVGQVIIEA
ncbi:MAG TPA: Ig-like domain-containing protein, partial [Gemmatimonadaceae bacterium]